ncbi:MAG: DNA polymerase III subunit beta [Treponema sp.]|nr:DNA polymerase III subunit beta [Treponema sp.]
MKFTFDRDAMIKEIAIAQEIITNKSPVSILSNILLIAENNYLTIKASDNTVKYVSTIPVEIQEEGRTTVYCDKFMGIISKLPAGEVEFTQEDIKAKITVPTKKIKFDLNSQTSDKFPEMGSSENVSFFEVPAKEFKEMIRQTIFAVSNDTSRIFLTGVYLLKNDQNLIMVSTDGHRLSNIEKPIANNIPDFQPAIIPTKILNCIMKHASDEGNIQVAVVEKSIFVKFSNYEFSSSLIDGLYPNYKKVIPEVLTSSFSVYKADLKAALERTTIMVDKTISRILFKVSSGVLKIVTPESANGNASEEIPCRYDGPDVTVGLNYNFITDPLKVIDSEYVVFEFTPDEGSTNGEQKITKTVVMHSDPVEDYQHIVMPMNN